MLTRERRARWWWRDGARRPRRKNSRAATWRAQVFLGTTLCLASCVLTTSDAGDTDDAGDVLKTSAGGVGRA